MTPPLVIAVSPYHLTTREAPAVAALQLADSVVTLLPCPPTGRTRADVEGAVKKCPKFLRLMESWRWTMPLWHEGLIASALDDAEVTGELRSSYERIGSDDDLAGLRPLTRHAAAASADEFLDLLSGDIVRGGPDPGLNIPVVAAIDEFASRHGIVVARSAAVSVAQRAEASLGRRIFGVAAPVLTRASARVILRVRAELEPELRALRHELALACEPGVERLDDDAGARLSAAALRYAAAFDSVWARLAGHDDDEGIRITSGYVSIVGLVVPADVAMRSGLAAARAMSMRATPIGARAGNGRQFAATAAGRLTVLVIKELTARPGIARG